MRPNSKADFKHKGGFTLLELMIAILIFAIIGGILTMVVSTGSLFFSQENSQIDNQVDLTTFSLSMEKDIRKTSSLSVSGNCLVLGQSGGNVSYCHNASTQTLTRNGTVLTRRIASMAITILGSQVDLVLQSIADRRGDVNSYRQHYVLREGNY